MGKKRYHTQRRGLGECGGVITLLGTLLVVLIASGSGALLGVFFSWWPHPRLSSVSVGPSPCPGGPACPKWESQVPGGGGVTDGSEWVCIQGKVDRKITPRPLEFSLLQGFHAGW